MEDSEEEPCSGHALLTEDWEEEPCSGHALLTAAERIAGKNCGKFKKSRGEKNGAELDDLQRGKMLREGTLVAQLNIAKRAVAEGQKRSAADVTLALSMPGSFVVGALLRTMEDAAFVAAKLLYNNEVLLQRNKKHGKRLLDELIVFYQRSDAGCTGNDF